jgi:hypothetical protein
VQQIVRPLERKTLLTEAAQHFRDRHAERNPERG